jgi:hypothetical protein
MEEPDNIYLDIQISNINNENTAPIILNYNQTRDTPILKNPSDYELSIVRFSLQTTSLPYSYQSFSIIHPMQI